MTHPYLDNCPRPAALILNSHGEKVVRDMLLGTGSNKDLKQAFDWENTPEGHAYWSKQRKADELSMEARAKLARALKLNLADVVRANDNQPLALDLASGDNS